MRTTRIPKSAVTGLRWLIALHAFLAARGAQKPILLVDEAETHLHYDAQADLIDALMNQRVVCV
jgi:predicted ATP-dependent endonuclease of OLD family